MEEQKIKSIENGNGEGSTYYTTESKWSSEHNFVDEIKLETKTIGKGYYNDLTLDEYCGYKDGKLVFRMTANNQLTIRYY